MVGRNSMMKVLRKILNRHPSILDAIQLKIVNFTELARFLREEVELEIGRRISIDAIRMGLMRYMEKLASYTSIQENKIMKVLADSSIELKSDIVVATFDEKSLWVAIPKIINNIGQYRFFQFTQGIGHITLVVDRESYPKILQVVGSRSLLNLIPNQSAIVLTSPRGIIDTPGVIAYITSLLWRNGINITQVISCHVDTIFVLDREAAVKTYSLLESLILSLRSKSSSSEKRYI